MLREKAQAAPTARPKVPMRRLGADCSVMKRGNARGAKGAGHRHWARVNRQREEPDAQWKAAAFARWHEQDDARVSSRICEGLGVKFPGPTRQEHVLPQRNTVGRFTSSSGHRDSSCRSMCIERTRFTRERAARNQEQASHLRRPVARSCALISRTRAPIALRTPILSAVQSPCLKLPLRLPRGPPEPLAPPCIRHLARSLTAACLQG